MEDSHDFDDITPQPIHDSIRPDDELAQIGQTEFRDHSTGFGKRHQSFGFVEKTHHDQLGISNRIPSDFVVNRLEILD